MALRILVVNAGSSSIRLAARVEGEPDARARGRWDRGEEAPEALLRSFAEGAGLGGFDAAVHRVVHGGPRFAEPTVVTPAVEAELGRLEHLAPLHNPEALRWLRAARKVLGRGALQVAAFDTGFYRDLPERAATYALPAPLRQRHGLRRYGFHGLAHQAMWERWRALHPDAPPPGRVVSLQLGAGCSATATQGGAPLDTSMGFTPLEGLVMATRCGDLDPGIVTFLQRAEGWGPGEVEEVLQHRSGLVGLGLANGNGAPPAEAVREVLAEGTPAARLAVEVFAYRAMKQVAAYLAVLGGAADAILVGGGLGEHHPRLRARILAPLAPFGVLLDEARNAAAVGREGRISADGSSIEAWVLPPDEEGLLARAAVACLRPQVVATGPGAAGAVP